MLRELIAQLTHLLEVHGDLPVYHLELEDDHQTQEQMISIVEVREPEQIKLNPLPKRIHLS